MLKRLLVISLLVPIGALAQSVPITTPASAAVGAATAATAGTVQLGSSATTNVLANVASSGSAADLGGVLPAASMPDLGALSQTYPIVFPDTASACTVASATSITLPCAYNIVTGTTPIATITGPSNFTSSVMGHLLVRFGSGVSITAAGNVNQAYTTQGWVYDFWWDGPAGKWYIPGSAGNLTFGSLVLTGGLSSSGTVTATNIKPGEGSVSCTGSTAIPINTGEQYVTVTAACAPTFATGTSDQQLMVTILMGTSVFAVTTPSNVPNWPASAIAALAANQHLNLLLKYSAAAGTKWQVVGAPSAAY